LSLVDLTFQCCLPQDTDNPQTEADRRAHRCIVSSLTARFPNITIISEEVHVVNTYFKTIMVGIDIYEHIMLIRK